MKAAPYKPRFFSSLIKSCYDGEFYSKIHRISFMRALLFLFLYSLMISLIAVVVLAMFWTQLFPTQEAVLRDYDAAIPEELQGSFDGETLELNPSPLVLFLGVEENGKVRLTDEQVSQAMIRLHFDSQKEIDDLEEESSRQIGVFALRDGLVVSTGFQDHSFAYADFESTAVITFDKQLLRVFLQSAFPIIQDWVQRFLLVSGPIVLFAYHILGALLIGVIYALLGAVVLMILQKRVRFLFLMKLSFYAAVPAFVVSLITALLGISVAFIPVIVFTAYYFYGLMSYDPKGA